MVTTDPLGEEGPNRNDIILALNSMAAFLNALTDKQIGMLKPAQRDTVQKFLLKAALRFAVGLLISTEAAPTVSAGDKTSGGL